MTLSIEASQTNCVAPCGVHFRGDVQNADDGVRPFHDFNYDWNFGDAASRFRSLGEGFPFTRSANRAVGPFAGHVFATPGTYNVTVTLTLPDGVRQASDITINVRDPNQAYGGSNTIVFSSNGDFSGAPRGAERYTDFQDAVRALDAFSKGRLLIRAGEVFTANSAVEVRDGKGFAIDKFGSGPDPIFDLPANSQGFRFFDVDNISVANIHFRGDYDPTTGQGADYGSRGITLIGRTKNLTVWRTTHSGVSFGLRARDVDGLVYADNYVTDWYDYGVFLDGPNDDQTALVGNRITQNINAVSGPGGKSSSLPRWADHGPMRIAVAQNIAISQNDLLSRTGWSSNGNAHQPTISLYTNNTETMPDHSGVIAMNRLAGGFSVVAMTVANSRAFTPDVGDTLIEQNVFIGTDNTRRMIESNYGGVSARRNFFLMPDVASSFQEFRGFYEFKRTSKSTWENDRAPISLDESVLVSYQDSKGRPVDKTAIGQSWANTIVLQSSDIVTVAPAASNTGDFSSLSESEISALVRDYVGVDYQSILDSAPGKSKN